MEGFEFQWGWLWVPPRTAAHKALGDNGGFYRARTEPLSSPLLTAVLVRAAWIGVPTGRARSYVGVVTPVSPTGQTHRSKPSLLAVDPSQQQIPQPGQWCATHCPLPPPPQTKQCPPQAGLALREAAVMRLTVHAAFFSEGSREEARSKRARGSQRECRGESPMGELRAPTARASQAATGPAKGPKHR